MTLSAGTGKVLTFGEMLLRFSPDANLNWLANNQVPVFIGGAELNVATALAKWGVPAKYFTALPANDVGDQLTQYIADRDIDASDVYRNDGRMGVLYLTQGTDLKQNSVIYDRGNSAFATVAPGQVDWDEVLKDVSWFHFSAICPALSKNTANLCEEALTEAAKRNITISLDLNYRAKLWQYGEHPHQVMKSLARHCTLIMGNVWAAETLLGIPVTPDIHESGQRSIYLKEALHASERIIEAFPSCKVVANTFRFNEGQGIVYYTSVFADGEFYSSPEYNAEKVVDKVGSGDCFMAGLIYGCYNQFYWQQTLDFATAAAFKKLFIAGDATTNTVEEIEEAIKL